MKTYEVALVSRITVPIQAETALEAIKKSKEMHPVYYPDEVSTMDGEEQLIVHTCEACEQDFLDNEDYTVSAEDGYYVCEKCSKEAANEA